MPLEILLTEEYPHPPEKVWRLLTDSEQLARWLMPNDFRPEAGRAFTMTTAPRPGFDGIVRCRVLEIEPPRHMVWEWRSGSMESSVAFELEKTARGSRLTLRQDGFRGVGGVLPWLFMRHGWKEKLHTKIAALLAAR
jgi:uncharacterized protein YndB with AHSA1/START domain